MDDLISRQAAELALIEKGQASKRYKLGEFWELNGKEIREALDTVPVVKPETGKWIRWIETIEDESGIEYIPHCKCPECGLEYEAFFTGFVKYCYRCGAKIEDEPCA